MRGARPGATSVTASSFNVRLGLQVEAARAGEVELRLAWRHELGQSSGFMHAATVDTAQIAASLGA